MKTITAKHIPSLETMTDEALFAALNTEAEGNPLACVNWKEFPYAPEVRFHIAFSEKALAILYQVK
jgi:hypothetical protein